MEIIDASSATISEPDGMRPRWMASSSRVVLATARIPVPAQLYPEQDERWRPIRFSGGADVVDQHSLFTSAACVAALARTRN